ncbi:hypothetical protein F751_6694 [Auxenochlorella protothecoides]|uniref:Uncharacterized protein n=1 Tax=Auxenochlorella protothecoides TaxID=3075 RepID=A0A087SQL5_AUXPR|nr:hypothetical protein F751_6694 [Auxenochlorella protothecoides]KFM28019.1 hypothetical protein F751_6694 [Auxenochlorella protothecoides]
MAEDAANARNVLSQIKARHSAMTRNGSPAKPGAGRSAQQPTSPAKSPAKFTPRPLDGTPSRSVGPLVCASSHASQQAAALKALRQDIRRRLAQLNQRASPVQGRPPPGLHKSGTTPSKLQKPDSLPVPEVSSAACENEDPALALHCGNPMQSPVASCPASVEAGATEDPGRDIILAGPLTTPGTDQGRPAASPSPGPLAVPSQGQRPSPVEVAVADAGLGLQELHLQLCAARQQAREAAREVEQACLRVERRDAQAAASERSEAALVAQLRSLASQLESAQEQSREAVLASQVEEWRMRAQAGSMAQSELAAERKVVALDSRLAVAVMQRERDAMRAALQEREAEAARQAARAMEIDDLHAEVAGLLDAGAAREADTLGGAGPGCDTPAVQQEVVELRDALEASRRVTQDLQRQKAGLEEEVLALTSRALESQPRPPTDAESWLMGS